MYFQISVSKKYNTILEVHFFSGNLAIKFIVVIKWKMRTCSYIRYFMT